MFKSTEYVGKWFLPENPSNLVKTRYTLAMINSQCKTEILFFSRAFAMPSRDTHGYKWPWLTWTRPWTQRSMELDSFPVSLSFLFSCFRFINNGGFTGFVEYFRFVLLLFSGILWRRDSQRFVVMFMILAISILRSRKINTYPLKRAKGLQIYTRGVTQEIICYLQWLRANVDGFTPSKYRFYEA